MEARLCHNLHATANEGADKSLVYRLNAVWSSRYWSIFASFARFAFFAKLRDGFAVAPLWFL